MGHMCRYSYLSGACANKHVESLVCEGEEDCEYSEMNILTRRRSAGTGDCGPEKWLGLYCERHRKFYCPGRNECPSHVSALKAPSGPRRTILDDGEI
jgi:hypothetical protein